MPRTEKTQTARIVSLQSIILIVILIMGGGIIFLLQTKDSSYNPTVKQQLGKGAPAPEFTLPDLNGTMVSLADYKGKVVFLNIWATWCPPCVQEMPAMEKLYQELKDEKFDILAVSIDTTGTEAVRSFMEKHKLNFTALSDAKETLRYKYQTTGVPETYIIDKRGVIVEKIIGPRDWANAEVLQYFRDLIQKD